MQQYREAWLLFIFIHTMSPSEADRKLWLIAAIQALRLQWQPSFWTLLIACQENQRILERAPTEWVIKYSGQFTMYWPELVTWLHQSPKKHKSSTQHLPRKGSTRNIRWKVLMSTSEYQPDTSYRLWKPDNWWGRTFTY